MDYSRNAISGQILDILRGAGIWGLPAKDIFDVLRADTSLSIKDVISCLIKLRNDGSVEMEGHKWKIRPSTTNSSDWNSPNPEKAVHPETVYLPKIQLPDHPAFTSYKNSLQEYCQKLGLGVPQYHQEKFATGTLSTVSFNAKKVTSEIASDNVKEADQKAAFQALIELSYISENAPFQTIQNLKRKDVDMTNVPNAKQVCVESSKSTLNELAQKQRLPKPIYDTLITPNGFTSTVTFNERQFKSSSFYLKKKDAEHCAAHVALSMIQVDGYDTQQPAQSSPGKSGQQSILSLKSRLQEYCQRLHKQLPSYDTKPNEDMTFTSSVTVEGETYTGPACSSKKSSQMAAAEVALKALGLMAV